MNLITSLFSNTLIAFLTLISIVVVAHELGHFLVGRLLGIGVEEFAVGFGPKIFSFKIGHTEYRVNWFLLGGYVRFYGADTEQSVSPENRERSILHAKLYKRMLVSFAGPFANFILSLFIMMLLFSFGVTKQPAVFRVLDNSPAYQSGLRSGDKVLAINGENVGDWSVLIKDVSESPNKPLKIEIERNGTSKNFILTPQSETITMPDGEIQTVGRAGITPFFSEPIIAPWQGQFFTQIGLREGDRIVSINNVKMEYLHDVFNQMENLTQSNSDVTLATHILHGSNKLKPLHFVVLRNGGSQDGIEVNFQSKKMRDWASHVLGQTSVIKHGVWSSVVSSSELTIAKFEEENANKKKYTSPKSLVSCGLTTEDTLRKIDNSNMSSRGLTTGTIFTSQVELYAWLESKTNEINKNIAQFKNNSIPTNILATDAHGAEKTYSCFLPIRSDRNELNKEKLFIDLPVVFASKPVLYPPLKMQGKNIFEDIKFGFHSVLSQTTFIYTGFKKLFSGHVPLSSLGGPIAIAGFAGDAAKAGFETFLLAMSLMSINIGIFNLLPLPALDGGTLLVQFVELIYRKPIPQNVQLMIARLGIAFLLTLFIFVFYNDIIRLFH